VVRTGHLPLVEPFVLMGEVSVGVFLDDAPVWGRGGIKGPVPTHIERR